VNEEAECPHGGPGFRGGSAPEPPAGLVFMPPDESPYAEDTNESDKWALERHLVASTGAGVEAFVP